MQTGVARRNDVSAARWAAAGPRRDDAASTFDDRDERRDIVGLQTGLDDDIDETCGEQAVTVAVAAIAREPRLFLQRRKGGLLFGPFEHFGVGGRQNCIVDAGALARLEPHGLTARTL